MMDILVILDIIGLIFGISGAILVGKLNRNGFLCFITGSTAHGILGLMQGSYGLMATCLTFIIIDIYYYRQWGLAAKTLAEASEQLE